MKKNTKKQAKTRNLYKTSNSSDLEYTKIIKIALGVILILGLTYFVTALVSGEIKFGKDKEVEDTPATIQYDEIIAGQIFNRGDSEYYVMMFDFTDTFASYLLTLEDSYSSTDDALPVYILDLEKKINEMVVAEDEESVEANRNTNSVSNLKVINPTLLRIRNHRVTQVITGRDNIIDVLDVESE